MVTKLCTASRKCIFNKNITLKLKIITKYFKLKKNAEQKLKVRQPLP